MTNYNWVEELKINRFSNRALVLVSRFARTLKQLNGRCLDLQDPMIAPKIFNVVRQSRNPELKSLFDQLLIELHILVESGDAVRCPESNDDLFLKELNEKRISVAKATMMTGQRKPAYLV